MIFIRNYFILIVVVLSSQCFAENLETINNSETRRQLEKMEFQQKDAAQDWHNGAKQELSGLEDFVKEAVPVEEKPCHILHEITLKMKGGDESIVPFRGALYPIAYGNGRLMGKCIGTKGLGYLLNIIQNELIVMGFVTTQLEVNPQDFNEGRLLINVIPGRIGEVKIINDTKYYVDPININLLKKRKVLSVSDLEQTLENLKNQNGVNVKINILPASGSDFFKDNKLSGEMIEGELDGFSHIIINWDQYKPWTWYLSLDNSGTRISGRNQIGFGFQLINPIGLSDRLNVSMNSSLNLLTKKDNKSENISYSMNYTLPLGFWSVNAGYSNYQFDQKLLGLNNPVSYTGETKVLSAEIVRSLIKSKSYRASFGMGLKVKRSSNFIDDTEVLVQRRKTSLVNLEFNQQWRLFNNIVISGELGAKFGINNFGALPAPESLFGEGESLPKVAYYDWKTTVPFYLKNRPFLYVVNWLGQYSLVKLIPQDRFAIGGQYTVRGFDGETQISGEHGNILRQELEIESINKFPWLVRPYIGLDYGDVSGASARFYGRKSISGAVVGMRLNYQNIDGEIFLGRGLYAPVGMDKSLVFGFGVTWNSR